MTRKSVRTRAERGFDEIYLGYQALGEVLITRKRKIGRYRLGYLDGWADAMHHLGWAHEDKPVTGKNAFPLLRGKKLSRKVRKILKLRREEWRGDGA